MRSVDEKAFCSGTTATVCLLRNSVELVVAHCGDSRALLCRNGDVMRLTTDHKRERKGGKSDYFSPIHVFNNLFNNYIFIWIKGTNYQKQWFHQKRQQFKCGHNQWSVSDDPQFRRPRPKTLRSNSSARNPIPRSNTHLIIRKSLVFYNLKIY